MSRFGRYRVRDRIAVGGTAEVFRATVPERGDQAIVLKKVLPQHAGDPRFRKLFEEEAALLSTLSHPNLVELLDAGELRGTLFLALELVDGADLARLLSDAARASLIVPPAVAARLVLGVAEALEFLHSATAPDGRALQLIHGDVSPGNILVSRDGAVKLADLGLARAAGRCPTVRGKPDYLSPEQATPGARLDGRSDLFSLGAVLFELLSGVPPSRVEKDGEPRARRATGPLARLALRCLRRDPSRRPARASILVEELRGYLARVPARAADVGAWARRVLAYADEEPVGLDRLVESLWPDSCTDPLASDRGSS